jgi:hypothetical protein
VLVQINYHLGDALIAGADGAEQRNNLN